MTRRETEQQIGRDLALCDLIQAVGTKASKRKAAIQRKACIAQIEAWNEADSPSNLSDDELLSALGL